MAGSTWPDCYLLLTYIYQYRFRRKKAFARLPLPPKSSRSSAQTAEKLLNFCGFRNNHGPFRNFRGKILNSCGNNILSPAVICRSRLLLDQVTQATDHQACGLLYSQNHSQILPDFVYDSVSKPNHAFVKDTSADPATQVVQAATSQARSCLRADFRGPPVTLATTSEAQCRCPGTQSHFVGIGMCNIFCLHARSCSKQFRGTGIELSC